MVGADKVGMIIKLATGRTYLAYAIDRYRGIGCRHVLNLKITTVLSDVWRPFEAGPSLRVVSTMSVGYGEGLLRAP